MLSRASFSSQLQHYFGTADFSNKRNGLNKFIPVKSGISSLLMSANFERAGTGSF